MCNDVRESALLRLVADYVAAWNAHDVDRVASLFAEDGFYGEFGDGQVIVGRKEIVGYLQSVIAAIPDLAITMAATPILAHDGVLVHWVLTGTRSGWFAGRPPTGASFELPGLTALALKDDRIARAAHTFDVRAAKSRPSPRLDGPPSDIGSLFGDGVPEDNIWYGE